MTNKAKPRIIPKPEHWLKVLNKMLESGDYHWAEEYLKDVRGQVVEEDFITSEQTRAIQNIRRKRF